MPNNVYRFRRIKWGAPRRLGGAPRPNRPAPFSWDIPAILIGLIAIGVMLYFLFRAA